MITTRQQHGFTLLELLIALLVVIILSGILASAVGVTRSVSLADKTETIMNMAYNGIKRYQVEFGGAEVLPAPHPTLLMSDNRQNYCANPGHPITYGWPTAYAGILHVNLPGMVVNLTNDQRGTWSVRDLTGDGVINQDDGDSPEEAVRLFNTLFGASNVLTELRALDGVITQDDPPNILNNTLFSPDGPDLTVGASDWNNPPGLIHIGNVDFAAHRWKEYRLPSIGLYDAWGNEIFYVYDRISQSSGFISAGRDGVLAIVPSDAGEFSTNVNANATNATAAYSLADGDRDGSVDNIIVGFIVEE